MNINEVATLAGVSRATISRYLNGGYVSAQKKEIIKKVIDETGYKPLNSAQTLRSHKTNYIGVIIPKINSDSIGRMVFGITTILAEHNYQLLLACTNNDEQEELKYLNLFKENHVDGIILLGTVFTAEHKIALKQLTVPIVILAQYLPGYSCVYPDDYHAAKEITSYMANKATKWGFIHATKKDTSVGVKRMNGFLDGLSSCGQSIEESCMVESSFTFEGGYDAIEQLLSKHPDIDSILCVTDTMAAGAMRYLHEIGKKVPAEIQIAGFGDGTFSQATYPSLTTIHLSFKTSGQEATKILLEMIKSDKKGITKELKLGYHLVIKDSTR